MNARGRVGYSDTWANRKRKCRHEPRCRPSPECDKGVRDAQNDLRIVGRAKPGPSYGVRKPVPVDDPRRQFSLDSSPRKVRRASRRLEGVGPTQP